MSIAIEAREAYKNSVGVVSSPKYLILSNKPYSDLRQEAPIEHLMVDPISGAELYRGLEIALVRGDNHVVEVR